MTDRQPNLSWPILWLRFFIIGQTIWGELRLFEIFRGSLEENIGEIPENISRGLYSSGPFLDSEVFGQGGGERSFGSRTYVSAALLTRWNFWRIGTSRATWAKETWVCQELRMNRSFHQLSLAGRGIFSGFHLGAKNRAPYFLFLVWSSSSEEKKQSEALPPKVSSRNQGPPAPSCCDQS